MLQVKDCQALLLSFPSLGRTENVTLVNSLGRVLARDIVADIDQPPFNKSAMDGYACRLEDLPGPLKVSGEIAAGAYMDLKLEANHCYRIFTGAPVPKGADCVFMQEDSLLNQDGRMLFTQKESKVNICLQGEDMRTGDVAIKSGTMIQPQHMAIMAAFGMTHPLVAAKPKVAIICSGSELIEPEEKPVEGLIRNSNAYQLISQMNMLGANADYLGIITDNKEKLSETIFANIEKYNLIVVTGGASVGDYDFMPSVLSDLGAVVHFSALNIQPGKPVLLATLQDTHILGLSGNPVSSYLQFHLVAKPLLFRLMNCSSPSFRIIKTILEEPIKRKKNNRQLYVPVKFTDNGFAKPLLFNGSGHITALENFDGFAILEPGVNEVTKEQVVETLLL